MSQDLQCETQIYIDNNGEVHDDPNYDGPGDGYWADQNGDWHAGDYMNDDPGDVYNHDQTEMEHELNERH